jgi:hypothetical protein
MTSRWHSPGCPIKYVHSAIELKAQPRGLLYYTRLAAHKTSVTQVFSQSQRHTADYPRHSRSCLQGVAWHRHWRGILKTRALVLRSVRSPRTCFHLFPRPRPLVRGSSSFLTNSLACHEYTQPLSLLCPSVDSCPSCRNAGVSSGRVPSWSRDHTRLSSSAPETGLEQRETSCEHRRPERSTRSSHPLLLFAFLTRKPGAARILCPGPPSSINLRALPDVEGYFVIDSAKYKYSLVSCRKRNSTTVAPSVPVNRDRWFDGDAIFGLRRSLLSELGIQYSAAKNR